MVSWFVPQNQVGYDLSVAPQNRREDKDGTGHASRSSGLLCVEVKPKDGRFDDIRCGTVEVRQNYPSLVVIFLLAHRGILVS
jgi:hypothetical protein